MSSTGCEKMSFFDGKVSGSEEEFGIKTSVTSLLDFSEGTVGSLKDVE